MTLGMRNIQSVQGPASSLNCPAILVLEFWSMDNESPTAFPQGWSGASASNLRFSFWCNGLLTVVASLVAEHRPWDAQVVLARELGLCSCGTWA